MRLFILNCIKFSLIGIFPLIIAAIGYLYHDPFHVLKSYKDYSYPYITPNRDYVSTEMFLKNQAKLQYNSFVFGSSRTIAFKPLSWAAYLPKNAKPFMFDASGESVYGIYKKLKFLENHPVKIDNALIILCRDAAFAHKTNHEGHLFIKHPSISNESPFTFQLAFFKVYLSPKFLYAYHTYTMKRHFKPYMEGYIDQRRIRFDTITNEMRVVDRDAEIAANPDLYYKKKANVFYTRSNEKTDSIPRITAEHLYMLKEIKRILTQNKTQYKIVLSPLYEQIQWNKADLDVLKNLFEDKIYNFAGKNEFSEQQRNFYESSHYTTRVGDSIMRIIYTEK